MNQWSRCLAPLAPTPVAAPPARPDHPESRRGEFQVRGGRFAARRLLGRSSLDRLAFLRFFPFVWNLVRDSDRRQPEFPFLFSSLVTNTYKPAGLNTFTSHLFIYLFSCYPIPDPRRTTTPAIYLLFEHRRRPPTRHTQRAAQPSYTYPHPKSSTKMKPAALAAAALSLCVSLASAGVVTIPIKPDQVVPKNAGDCAFGVVTPLGCG